MSTVTLRRAETLAERAERESLFCLQGVSFKDFHYSGFTEGDLTFRARMLQTWLWLWAESRVVERMVLVGGCLQGSSGWLALFGCLSGYATAIGSGFEW